MLDKVNSGDQEALRAFLQTYAKYILNRATLKAPDEAIAREATRIAILQIKQAAEKGNIPAEPAPWIERLTDESVQRLTLPISPGKKQPSVQSAKPAAVVGLSPAQKGQQAPREARPSAQAQYQASQQQPQAAQYQNAQQRPRPQQQPQSAAQYGASQRQAQPAAAQYQPQRPQQAAQRPQSGAPERQKSEATQASRPVEKARPVHQQSSSRKIPDLFGSDEELREIDEKKRRKSAKKKDDAPVGMVFVIFLLVIVVLGLIWMLLVMLMSKGYLPVMDFGFAEWFNSNVFKLF